MEEVNEVCQILRTGTPVVFEFVKSIIDQFPNGVDAWAGRYWIANAIDFGSPEAVGWMLRQGVNIHIKDDEGYTVLHSAIERGGTECNEIIYLLIAAGADVDAH